MTTIYYYIKPNRFYTVLYDCNTKTAYTSYGSIKTKSCETYEVTDFNDKHFSKIERNGYTLKLTFSKIDCFDRFTKAAAAVGTLRKILFAVSRLKKQTIKPKRTIQADLKLAHIIKFNLCKRGYMTQTEMQKCNLAYQQYSELLKNETSIFSKFIQC